MASVRESDILFRSGGAEVLRSGAAWRRQRVDGREVEAPTFARADATTCATYVDRGGLLRTAAAGKLRLSWVDADSDGVFETPVLLLEPSRANVCLQSEDFGTTWAAVGTPTRSAGAGTIGVVSMDLIGDDAAGAAEGYSQDVVFTADAVKAVSLFVGQGTATKLFVRLQDVTASAERLGATVTWSGGTVSVVAGVGTAFTAERTGNGYRVLLQTTAVTAGNTNRLVIYPGNDSALTAADTGNAYVGGVQCENAPFPSSYIKTTTAAVTRAADSLVFPTGFSPDDNYTIYLRAPRPLWADASGSIGAADLYALNIGGGNGQVAVYADDATRVMGVLLDAATTDAQATQSIPAGAIEVCAQVRNITTGGDVRLDVGSGFGSYSSAASAFSAWASNVATVGSGWGGGIHKLLVARGLFTLAEMQAVDW